MATKRPRDDACVADDPFQARRCLFKAGGLMAEGYDGQSKFVIAAPGLNEFSAAAPVELTYFAIRALGQLPQLCLEVAGYPYRYTVVTAPYFKANLKSTLAFGRLPCVITTDGTEIVQSKAILRYVSKLCGLAGRNDSEAARCDMLHEMLLTEGKLDDAEIQKLEGGSGLEAVGDLKIITRRETLALTEEQKIIANLKFWEDMVGKSKSGYLLGGLGDEKSGELCYVDLVLYWTLRQHVKILTQRGCTGLAQFVERVHKLPGMTRLLESGRLMPSIDGSYKYVEDDLVVLVP